MPTTAWPRIIAHMDLDAFFAAIEQFDNPDLRGQPIAITNGEAGTTIITCSYEARAYGIKTGMRMAEAKTRCSTLIKIPSRPHRYAEVSSRIMDALQTLTPDIEIFSVDEAFLEFTHCKRLYKGAKQLAQTIQQCVMDVSGISCSVGLSGDKTTAKYASKLKKPAGLVIIPPWEAKAALAGAPVTKLCGVARGVATFLAQYGVTTCGDMQTIPMSVLSRRFGNIGKRIWLMAQGNDPEPLLKDINDPKTMGCGKVIPPNTTDKYQVQRYVRLLSEKLGYRLRENQFACKTLSVSFKLQYYWLRDTAGFILPTQDDLALYTKACSILTSQWNGEGIFQCQLTAIGLVNITQVQLDFDVATLIRTENLQ